MESVDRSVDCCVIYHKNKYLSTEIDDDTNTEYITSTSLRTDVDDSMYYNGDHCSEEDNYIYHDIYSSNFYSTFNADVIKDKIDLPSKPILVESKEPDYEK